MTWDEVYKLVSKVSALSVIIPLILYCLTFKALHKYMGALLAYIILCGLADLLSYISLDHEIYILEILNVFTILEGLLLFYLYEKALNNRTITILIRISVGIFLIVAITRFVFQNKFSKEDDVVSTLASAFIGLFAAVCLYRQLVDPSIKKLERYYFFWINLAFLLYFGTSFLLFFNNDFIANSSQQTAQIIWSIHQFLNLTGNILISYGLWQAKQIQH